MEGGRERWWLRGSRADKGGDELREKCERPKAIGGKREVNRKKNLGKKSGTYKDTMWTSLLHEP